MTANVLVEERAGGGFLLYNPPHPHLLPSGEKDEISPLSPVVLSENPQIPLTPFEKGGRD